MRTGIRATHVGLSHEGDRQPDSIAGLLGAHPIEVAIGAALAGMFLAMAMGAVAGPGFAAFGAVVGALAGACVGNGVGEVISPRLCAPEDVAPRGSCRTSEDRPGSTDDQDDFKTFGTDLWPGWYDAVALGRRN